MMRQKHFVALVIVLSLYTIPWVANSASAQESSSGADAPDSPNELNRDPRSFDGWAANVRKYMNSDPQMVGLFLDDAVARNLGDDPRALDLCEEVILKSTNSESIDTAVGAIELIDGWWVTDFDVSRKRRIAVILGEAFNRPDLRIRLDAANILYDMGPQQKKLAYEFYANVLRDPPDENKFTEFDKKQYGHTKRFLVEVIRHLLLKEPQPDNILLIRRATSKFQLLDYWKEQIKISPAKSWRQSEENFVVKWQSVLDQK
jgi:hypothetical protein